MTPYKFLKITLFSLSGLFLFSCNISESYLLTKQSKYRIIERQDHQQCVSQGLDYGEWDEIITEMYWRCRYNLLQDRKIHDSVSDEAIKNNAFIDKISEEILKNLNRAKFSALAKIEDDINLSDHNSCLKKGYGIDGDTSSDQYYLCRQNLIISRIPPAPKVTNSFETAILPSEKANKYLEIAKQSRVSDTDVSAISTLMQKYPNCLGLNVESEDFKKCSFANDESQKCLTKISSLRIKKELQDKIYCQQQSFIQFPDNYSLAKDKSSSEIEKLKLLNKKEKDKILHQENNATLSYLEGNQGVDNIGRYENIENAEEKTKEKLYSRVELLKLREKFIYQCNQKMVDKLPDFTDKSTQDCLNISKNWDKEESLH